MIFRLQRAPEKLAFYVILKHSNGRTLNLQMGRLHGYEGIPPQKVVQTVLEGVRAGTKTFILTNASGGTALTNKPGSVMMIKDHINLTGQNPLTGPNTSGPRFPDMSNAYDAALSKQVAAKLKKQKLKVFDGVYGGLAGPNYETPAEIRLLVKCGVKAVGMSTVWETIALAHAGVRVAGVALITNFGAGLKKEKLNHHDVLEQAAKSAKAVIQGIFDFAEGFKP
jgi:purine-nucleoside phosphorylase